MPTPTKADSVPGIVVQGEGGGRGQGNPCVGRVGPFSCFSHPNLDCPCAHLWLPRLQVNPPQLHGGDLLPCHSSPDYRSACHRNVLG